MPPEMPYLLKKGMRIAYECKKNGVDLGPVKLVPLVEEGWY